MNKNSTVEMQPAEAYTHLRQACEDVSVANPGLVGLLTDITMEVGELQEMAAAEQTADRRRRDDITESENETVSVVIDRTLENAVTVGMEVTRETRHIVEFETTTIADLLGQLPGGSRIALQMERLKGRGNSWRAIRLESNFTE